MALYDDIMGSKYHIERLEEIRDMLDIVQSYMDELKSATSESLGLAKGVSFTESDTEFIGLHRKMHKSLEAMLFYVDMASRDIQKDTKLDLEDLKWAYIARVSRPKKQVAHIEERDGM